MLESFFFIFLSSPNDLRINQSLSILPLSFTSHTSHILLLIDSKRGSLAVV